MEKDPNIIKKIVEKLNSITYEKQKAVYEMIKDWPESSTRGYNRLEIKTDVDILVDEKLIQASSKNLSATGIFINKTGPFEPFKNIRIVFTVPGYNKPFKLNGEIVRVEKTGIAIEFKEITPYFKNYLDGVIWNKNQEETN